jgi:CDP-paratose 2-epimerase
MLEEYRDRFSIPVIINRCGVLSGPWQFGKSDQGIAAFWTAAHMNGKNLKYIGFRGCGKQVRDFLHIDDLFELIKLQMEGPEKFSRAGFFNVGGGRKISASLLELTGICEKITGRKIEISPAPELRYADIPVYLTDNAKINNFCKWSAQSGLEKIVQDIHDWINSDPKARCFFD